MYGFESESRAEGTLWAAKAIVVWDIDILAATGVQQTVEARLS